MLPLFYNFQFSSKIFKLVLLFGLELKCLKWGGASRGHPPLNRLQEQVAKGDVLSDRLGSM